MVSTQAWYTSMECRCAQLRTVVSYWHLTNPSVICRVTWFLTQEYLKMIFAQVTLKTTSLKWLSRSLLLKCLWRRLLLKEFNMTSLDNHLTLKMASAQIVETSVANNSLSQDSNHADDLFHSRHQLSISVEQSSTLYHGQSTEPTLMKDEQWDWVSKQISKDLRTRCQLLLTKLILLLKDNQCGDKRKAPK